MLEKFTGLYFFLLPWNVGKVTCIEGLPVKKLMKVETKEDQTKIRKIRKKTLYQKSEPTLAFSAEGEQSRAGMLQNKKIKQPIT